MTRIFLVTGIVLTALALVPTASAMIPEVEGGVDSAQLVGTVARDSHHIVATQAVATGARDSHHLIQSSQGSVGERSATTRGSDVFVKGDYFVPPAQFEVSTAAADTSSSGRDIEWSQIGLGLGIGLLLALGLLMAARATRVRPVAH